MKGVLAPWQDAWDAYLETLGKAAEGTLTSPEFLRLRQRRRDLRQPLDQPLPDVSLRQIVLHRPTRLQHRHLTLGARRLRL
ncbi:MAG: hypothetical protein KGL53_05105, partial [Elusimicrobia bacterium]|nr:hypothetical protein [Elusimicrobiota bacterium]